MAIDAEDIVIQLPPEAYEDLAAVAQHSDELAAVSKVVARLHVTADVASVVPHIAKELSTTEPDARSILYGLLNLHYLRADLDVTGKELIEILTKNLERGAPEAWKDQNLETWHRGVSAMVASLAPNDALAILQKARQLEYTHQNVLRRARILTDVRPVFDDDADRVLNGIISHVLVLEYVEGRQVKRLHLALDTNDVSDLKKQCERAEVKEATAKDWVSKLRTRD
jgi:hypothetical protein